MQLTLGEYQHISLFDEFGRIPMEMIVIVSKAGSGKSVTVESIANEYHKLGCLVIVVSDVKDKIESGFAQFLPEAQYHLRELQKIGKTPEAVPVKLYHPFTFRIPRRTQLPPINFYTLNIQELGRDEWSMLSETIYESDTVRNLLLASGNLAKDDGIYTFAHNMEDSIKGKTTKKQVRRDPKNFYLAATLGTMKSLQDIANVLQPFKKDYFLTPASCEINLDMKSLLADQKHYHVFISNWIDDKKLKEFLILSLLRKIRKYQDYAKCPIVVVIPEVRYLTPFRPQGYKEHLANSIKENLSTFRVMGKGITCILDSQLYTDCDENVRGSGTVTLFGELGSPDDIDELTKSLGYKRPIREQLSKMDGKCCYLIKGSEDSGQFKFFPPPHMHCEEGYVFWDMYKKHFPDKMQTYDELIAKMQAMFQEEEKKIRDKVSKLENEEKANKEKYEKQKTAKSSIIVRAEEQIQKAKEIKKSSKEEIKALVRKYKSEHPDDSYRVVGQQFNIDHKTAKKYCEEEKGDESVGSQDNIQS